MYKCTSCGMEIDSGAHMENKCPKCRSRLLIKVTPKIRRRIISK
ncbi:MAG: DNA-directed RNA polymerase subunit P [Methanobrevibacter sp.]|jgi:DNA-directed RNA polymerase subunit P|nr:DNA-directed RNA polymerase subunit P [Methanobrevibacter sp.]